jgi:hypothetical protein
MRKKMCEDMYLLINMYVHNYDPDDTIGGGTQCTGGV